MSNSSTNSSIILMGVIQSPYGIQGGMRVKSYSHSFEDFKSYKVFQTEDGVQFFHLQRLTLYKGDTFNAFFKEINDRNQADTWRNTPLYITASQLKKLTTDEYYHQDLIGLRGEDEDGKTWGLIKNIIEGGGGTLLVLQPNEVDVPEVMIPFRREFVPEVDIKGGKIVIDRDYLMSLLEIYH